MSQGGSPADSCGNGSLDDSETCDDGNQSDADGCDSSCLIENGYSCSGEPSVCVEGVCGDGVLDAGEACDEGVRNGVYFGDGSGCTSFCTFEPNCRDSMVDGCTSPCGDGMRIDPEECDDGNLTDGDGCSADCAVEDGFTCTNETLTDTRPCSQDAQKQCLVLPIIYRDFIAAGFPGGHDDFLLLGKMRSAENGGATVSSAWMGLCQSMVDGTLNAQGKPELRPDYVGCAELGNAPSITSAATFLDWYDNNHPAETTHLRTLELEQVAATSSYQYDDDALFPLDGLEQNGELQYCGEAEYNDRIPLGTDPCAFTHNYHFTSEIRYVFRYQGGEVLNFRGDDDVFVFVNGQKVVDLGGVRNPETGSVSLDGEGLTLGRIYEIAVFQAERHPIGSNYQLTLSGFEVERTTSCTQD